MLDLVTILAAAWAGHPEHGINAIAATLPRDRRGQPFPLPPAWPLFNDQEDKAVAADVSNPDKVPAGVLWGSMAPSIDPPRGYATSRDCLVACAFVTDSGADALASTQQCGLFLRAAEICFRRMNSQALSKDYREMDGIKIHQVSRIVPHQVTATTGRRKMWGMLELHFWTVDLLS